MSLHTLIVRTEKLIGDNSPLILTGLGAAGVVTTAYLTGKASIRAYEVLTEPQVHPNGYEAILVQKMRPKKETFLLIWKLYLPAAGVGSFTIAAIIMANRIGTRRTAAMAAAYTVAERGFQEYREKVAETIGKKKETDIRDAVAQDQVTRSGITSNVVVIGDGDCIFIDARTMRPFKSTMQNVKHAINKINYKINHHVYASVNDWYDAIGLPRVPDGDDFGWSNVLLEPDMPTTVTDDEKPAFLIRFHADPIRGYDKIHP